MSNRRLSFAAIALLAVACTTATPNGGDGATPGTATAATSAAGGATPASAGGGSGTAGSGGAGGAAVAAAAAKVTDVCAVMPRDVIRAKVPDAGDPVTDNAYRQCTMSNGTTAVQLTLSSGFGEPDPPNPAESIADLGEKAWLQEQAVDDTYLVVYLGSTDTAGFWTMYVEYAGHDGKAHRDDAIGIAKAALATLQ